MYIKGKRVPKFPAGGVHLFCMQEKKEKKEGEKERKGERRKKIIPKYNKRRTVSADFHLHKFSYILVKIIAGAEQSCSSVEAEQRKSEGAAESPAQGHRLVSAPGEQCEAIFRHLLLLGHTVSLPCSVRLSLPLCAAPKLHFLALLRTAPQTAPLPHRSHSLALLLRHFLSVYSVQFIYFK